MPKRGKRVAVFNHKGGVGKTTLTANIACALAEKGKRVLLVDADPQCNLTSYFIEDSVVDDYLDASDGRDGRTVWSVVKPLVESDGNLRIVQPIELVHKGMYLVVGDIQLSAFEEELSVAWTDCFRRKPRGFACTCAISQLVDAIQSSEDFDFVFFDSGPNIGPLNRAIILDCDHLIIPAACDLFSLRAMKTMGHALAKWIEEWKTIADLAPNQVPMLSGSPTLIGYIPQRFRVYGQQPTTTFASMMPKLERGVQSEIVERVKEVDIRLASNIPRPLKLGEVKDFPLTAEAQRLGLPIWDVPKGNREQKEQAREAFYALADAIIGRTGQDERERP